MMRFTPAPEILTAIDWAMGRESHHMKRTKQYSKGFALFTLAAMAGTASAFELTLFEQPVKIDNLISIGALVRAQERDNELVGKSNVTPGLCLTRLTGNSEDGPNPNGGSRNGRGNGSNRYDGDTCTTSNGATPQTPSAANLRYVAAPGSYDINGDNGNLNFDKGDIVHAVAKFTTDISTTINDFNFFVRAIGIYDTNYYGFDEYHPDTTLIPRRTAFSRAGEDTIGLDFQFLDYFVSKNFEILDRQVSFKLGNQVLNWGESGFLLANSLNSINPVNQALLRVPGFDIKELSQPVGMLLVNAELFSGVNVEAFYQYEWKPVIADPTGSYFSSSDLAGNGNNQYILLGLGKAPEDPLNLYQPNQNARDPIGLLGSSAGRTAYRDYAEEERRRPSDGGQFGAALKLFLESFNGGTELAFYFANYHARVPTASVYTANESCIPPDSGTPATNLAGLAANCMIAPTGAILGGTGPTTRPQTEAGFEPIPVDTMRIFLEYPENIHMFGVSFNTTLGDWALSGEYAFRDNLPIQVHSVDLVFTAVATAFPHTNFSVGAATIGGQREAFPTFLPVFRDVTFINDQGDRQFGYGPNQYVPGFERKSIGQTGVTLLKTFGGDNFLNASQIVFLLEMGHTQVFDFPELGELQFNGGGTVSAISAGADGSVGINPRDVRSNPDDQNSLQASSMPGLRQNPSSHRDLDGFGTEFSYGYRLVTLTRYDSALFGANIELLNALFHDIGGVGPGAGQNFIEGRKQILSGIRWDYLSTYTGELRYTWFTGGNGRDALGDRDNILLTLGYLF